MVSVYGRGRLKPNTQDMQPTKGPAQANSQRLGAGSDASKAGLNLPAKPGMGFILVASIGTTARRSKYIYIYIHIYMYV